MLLLLIVGYCHDQHVFSSQFLSSQFNNHVSSTLHSSFRNSLGEISNMEEMISSWYSIYKSIYICDVEIFKMLLPFQLVVFVLYCLKIILYLFLKFENLKPESSSLSNCLTLDKNHQPLTQTSLRSSLNS